MMLQPGVICPAVCFYDAGGYTLTMLLLINFQMMKKHGNLLMILLIRLNKSVIL